MNAMTEDFNPIPYDEPAFGPPAAMLPEPTAPRPELSGLQKSVVLLLSLGPERAASVFKHLNETEIEQLSLGMAKAELVKAEEREAVLEEFVETAVAQDYVTQGGVAFAREVLEASVGPERAKEIIDRLSAMIEMRPFEFLRRTPPEQIYASLRNEAPQTIALTIANLHPTLASQVLSLLPPEEQAEVARRIAMMRETSPEVIKDVEGVMRLKLSNVLSQDYAAAGGPKGLADILNSVDRNTERNVLDSITSLDNELAEEIRLLLFVFEDIVKLDDRSMQLVLKETNQKDLVLSLRGSTDEVKAKVLSNMSQRGAEMLEEEMQYQAPQRRSLVEEAQGRIVGVIRSLEERGAIVIGRADGEDDLVL